MFRPTDDLRITQVRPLIPPAILIEEIPITERASNVISNARHAIGDALAGVDRRLVVIVGPCSIHDVQAATEYASRLRVLAERYAEQLIVIMRSYFEKPRTSVGWKGLINDPDLDESFHINKGLRLARQLLLDVNEMGLPTASEFLDTQIPQHIADLTSWVAPPRARYTASLPRGCRCRWASRTAPMAIPRSPSTPCRPPARLTGSRR
jgi:3-deoxy-7-phosphoheptulonate synthase